jgi:hypothetical protein
MKVIILGLLSLVLFATLAVQAQYTYTNADGSIYLYSTNADGSITIDDYTGPPWAVIIPTNIDSLPVTSIGDYSFNGTGLTSVTIPGGVSSIGYAAFFDCSMLASVTIANGVASIEEAAFELTSLTNVTIPASVTNIGEGAFAVCTNLAAITVDNQNSFYSSVNGVLFNKSQTTLVEFPDGIGGSYTILGSITNIGSDAFASGSMLTTVTIPGSVTSIGDNAFYGCTSLTNATIADGVTSIGYDAFAGCTSLYNVTIPGSVTNIGDSAFGSCFGLTSVYFKGNPPDLGPYVFITGANYPTLYYLPGATGWSSFYAEDCPVVLWNPLIQTGDASFGVRNNQFGFNVTGTANIPIVIEACTNLASPVWTPLQTLSLTNGLFYFSDPQWMNYPSRYYRISSP